MQNDSSTYRIVAEAFTVADIAQPISVTVSPEASVQEVWHALREGDGEQRFGLVQDDDTFCGYLAFDGACLDGEKLLSADNRRARDIAVPISPKLLVPSTLPVLSLLSDFDRSDFFFVLASGQLTHVVTRDCIDHEPVKLAVFAIVMELEVTMLDLLRVPPTPEAIEEKLQTLSTGRREKAQLRAQDKYNEVTPLGVLLATNFIDRSELVIEDNMEQLPFPSKNEARSFFSRAMRVRNQIAHGLDISSELASPGQVVAFVQEVEKVVTGLERVLGKLPPKPPL